MQEQYLVSAPKRYICSLDDDGLKCVPYSNPEAESYTEEKLVKYCSRHAKTRVLVRYPKGHYHNDKFMLTFQKHAQILFSESFSITKSQLNKLLYKFYEGSSRLNTHQALRDKCDKVWDHCGKITIFIFKLYDNCGCGRKHEDDFKHLKRMKKHIRAHFDDMHCLHTSDNHYETMAFVNELFG